MKKLFQKLKNLSIVWQISMVFAFVMLVPTTLVTYSYYRQFEESITEQATLQLKEDLAYIRFSIDTQLSSAQSLLDQMEFNQEFSYFMDADNQLSQREVNHFVSSVQGDLLGARAIYPNRFSLIALFPQNGQIPANHSWLFPFRELESTSYFPGLAEYPGRNMVGQIRLRELDIYTPQLATPADEGEPVLPVYRKIYNLSTGELVGVIELNIPLEKLLEQPHTRNNQQETIHLLLGANQEVLYQIPSNAKLNFSQVSPEGESGSGIWETTTGDYLVAYETHPETGITYVAATNKKMVLAPAVKMQQTLVIVSVAAIFFFFGVTNLLIRLLLRQLKEIDSKMTQIKEGNFDVHIATEGSNEVSRIAENFNSMASQLNSVMQKEIEYEKAKRLAELRALQAQINPHFLYNTLENMRMQCEIDEYYTLSSSLEALGEWLRYSINWEGSTVSLRQEWGSLHNYIVIMRMRFKNDLHCSMYCSEELMDVAVPKFILQPVVENSFNYGFESILPPWEISVDVYKEDDFLVATLTDNGAGIKPQRLEEINQCLEKGTSIPNTQKKRRSIGLSNVARRMGMLCPKGSSFTIDSVYGEGTTVTIRIKLEDKQGEESADV